MADENVTVRIEAVDGITPVLKSAASEADALGRAVDRTKTSLTASSPLLTRFGQEQQKVAATSVAAAQGTARFGTGLAAASAAAARSTASLSTVSAASQRAAQSTTQSASGMERLGTSARGVAASVGASIGPFSQLAAQARNTAAASTASTGSMASLAGAVNNTGGAAGRATGLMASLARSTSDTGRGSREAASGFAAITPALAAAGLGAGAMVRSFMSFDSTMSAVAANTGATGAQLDALRAKAVELGGATKFSGAEAAQGVNELAKAGVSAEQIIGGGLAGALSLAAAGQMEVGAAAETAASAMNQFGLAGYEIPHVADMLATAANAAQGEVHDMGMALSQTGLVANQVGLSIQETVGGLTAFAAAGLLGSDAGTSFKTMLQRLNPTTKDAQRAMDELGISAFDSNGNFVGLANVAGQLQTSMSGLTTEQRQAAMTTIFGSDAVRAATILYEQGADGISAYVEQVDQYGTAAAMAAQLTDNLSGDLEKFTGAIDSIVLDSGNGINAFVRSTVQGLTLVVETVGQIPGPVLQVGAALAALNMAGRVLPDLGPTFQRWTASATTFRTELAAQRAGMGAFSSSAAALGMSMQQVNAVTALAGPQVGTLTAAYRAAGGATGVFRGAVSGLVGVLGGPWGVALTAASALLAIFAARSAEARQRQAELQAATESVAGAVAASGGAWDVSAQKAFMQQTAVTNLVTEYGKLGYSVETMTTALTQEGSTRQAVIGQIDARIDALTREGTIADANTGIVMNLNQAEVNRLTDLRTGMTEAIGMAEQSIGLGQQQVAQDQAIEGAARGAADGIREQGAATGDMAAQSQQAAEAVDKLATGIANLGNVLLSQRDSARGFQAAIDSANEALAKNGQTLDINTAKGRANQDALDGIAQAGLKAAADTFKLTGSLEQTAAQVEATRTAFINVATAMGMSAPQARALANELGLTKGEVEALVGSLEAMPASKEFKFSATGVAETETAITSVTDAIVGVPASASVLVAAQGAAAVMSELQGVTKEAQTADAQNPIVQIAETGAAAVMNLLRGTTKEAQTTGAQKPVVNTSETGNAQVQGQLKKTTADAKVTGAQKPVVQTRETGNAQAQGQLRTTTSRAQEVGRQRPVVTVRANTSQAEGALSGLLSRLRAFAGSVWTAVTRVVTGNADGAIWPTIRAYASGGIENHVAQIAPAGAWRLWAEDETGGEAYIPLAASKRARSTMILDEVARRFGYALVKQAEGGLLRFADGGRYATTTTTPARPVSYTGTVPVNAVVTQVTMPRDVKVNTPGGALTGLPDVATAAIQRRWDELIAVNEKTKKPANPVSAGTFLLATNLTAKYSRQFLANIEKVANRGYPDVAARLLEMGEDQGAKPAAAFAGASVSTLNQQRAAYNETARQLQAATDLQARLTAATSPKAWVTASQTSYADNATWLNFLGHIARIRDRGYPTLAARLLEMGPGEAGDIARQAAAETDKNLRNLRHNLVDQAGAITAQRAEMAATMLGPRWRQESNALASARVTSQTFLSNIRRISERGFGTLALNLLERGEDEARDLAAEAANAADRDLSGWQGNITASEALQRQANALLDQLRGVGQVLHLAPGAATGSDPNVRWIAPAALNVAPTNAQYQAAQARQTTQSAHGPLVHIENMYAANPADAGTALETRLGDAVAVTGLGRVA